ncbi:helix-turn-helix transcriptional regulator [Mesorhizobium sp. 8]|uniref:helix-turn-helix domain-containing protein n=1 Tax=Mesorhizobium sp. 8 TaxID=2584466 RepID=UPI00111D01C6|nr:helix-turn-helix transcriptional regulator [Mesorhizobium sp. 8]QDC00368.1 helix-turn-helix transcriptional regulator [Mesorhizobium sp. 8]
MENLVARRIRLRLEAVGLNIKKAEETAELKNGFVRDLLSGRKAQPRPSHLAKLANVLDCDLEYLMLYQRAPRKDGIPEDGLPIYGVIEEGAWREAKEMAKSFPTSPYDPEPRFPSEHQCVFIVKGESSEAFGIVEDEVVITLLASGIEAIGRPFKPLDVVILNRQRNSSLHERSLAQVVSMSNGKINLRKAHGKPIEGDWSIEGLAVTTIRHLA